MIHVLTIHWQSNEWIDIQLKYLKQHINQPFRVYAFLNNVPNVDNYKNHFFYTCTEDIKSHPIKLNLLADVAKFASNDENDYLMFIDGDAFPISNLDQLINTTLTQFPAAAVQRLENNGDIQPHPCFCMMKIKTWVELNGDWKPGNIKWKDKFGKNVWDVGGQMLKIFDDNKINWYKLNRSNNHELHPLLFGVYDELIYHHGAAFRNPGTRVDKNNVSDFEKRLKRFRAAKKIMPTRLARALFLPLKQEIIKNKSNSEHIYTQIQENPLFFKNIGRLK